MRLNRVPGISNQLLERAPVLNYNAGVATVCIAPKESALRVVLHMTGPLLHLSLPPIPPQNATFESFLPDQAPPRSQTITKTGHLACAAKHFCVGCIRGGRPVPRPHGPEKPRRLGLAYSHSLPLPLCSTVLLWRGHLLHSMSLGTQIKDCALSKT